MARQQRIRVTRPERHHWLEQSDAGEGITKIAKASGRDIRIVKRHIEIAREEVQMAAVKKEFLLGRLQQHQDDLLVEAARIRGAVVRYPPPALVPEDPLKHKLFAGLRQHLSPFPTGRLMSAFEKAQAEDISERTRIRDALKQREEEILGQMPKPILTYPWASSIMTELEAGRLTGDLFSSGYEKSKTSGGRYELRYQAQNLVRTALTEKEADAVIQAHSLLLIFANELQVSLMGFRSRLLSVGATLADEMDNIAARRVVTGRCSFCPL